MSYYIRIFGLKDPLIPLDPINIRLSFLNLKAELITDEMQEDRWESAVLKHKSGKPIADIERSVVGIDSLAWEEIQEFLEQIKDCKPTSASVWLQERLKETAVLYVFELRDGVEQPDGWNALHAVQMEIRNQTDGILQADGEGFYNSDGHTILWQFDDDVSGLWNAAVLDEQGQWVAFEMDMGSADHRRAFMDGNVPARAKLL